MDYMNNKELIKEMIEDLFDLGEEIGFHRDAIEEDLDDIIEEVISSH